MAHKIRYLSVHIMAFTNIYYKATIAGTDD